MFTLSAYFSKFWNLELLPRIPKARQDVAFGENIGPNQRDRICLQQVRQPTTLMTAISLMLWMEILVVTVLDQTGKTALVLTYLQIVLCLVLLMARAARMEVCTGATFLQVVLVRWRWCRKKMLQTWILRSWSFLSMIERESRKKRARLDRCWGNERRQG
jgi:hypothetical protein